MYPIANLSIASNTTIFLFASSTLTISSHSHKTRNFHKNARYLASKTIVRTEKENVIYATEPQIIGSGSTWKEKKTLNLGYGISVLSFHRWIKIFVRNVNKRIIHYNFKKIQNFVQVEKIFVNEKSCL